MIAWQPREIGGLRPCFPRNILPRTKRNVENGKWTEISKKRSEKDRWKEGRRRRRRRERKEKY